MTEIRIFRKNQWDVESVGEWGQLKVRLAQRLVERREVLYFRRNNCLIGPEYVSEKNAR